MRKLPVWVVFAAVAASPIAATRAQSNDTRRSETVRCGDLDLNNRNGAVTLFRRLHTAAAEGCAEPAGGTGYADEPLYQRCLDHALTVSRVDQPAVTAYALERGVSVSSGKGAAAH